LRDSDGEIDERTIINMSTQRDRTCVRRRNRDLDVLRTRKGVMVEGSREKELGPKFLMSISPPNPIKPFYE
jgi:hypothetical protein